jgi:hypothetical protein
MNLVLNPTFKLFKPNIFRCGKPKSSKLAFKKLHKKENNTKDIQSNHMPNKAINDFLMIGKGVEGEFI